MARSPERPRNWLHTPCGGRASHPTQLAVCRALSASRCAPLRRSSPSWPEAPWKRCMLYRHTAVCDGKNTWSDFNGLQGDQPPQPAQSLGENLMARFLRSPRGSGTLTDRRRLFHDSPGEPSPRTRFPVAAMSAPEIEHGRVSALMRGSMEDTACYAQEMRYRQCVSHQAHERQAAHGNDTEEPGGPAAGESGWNAPARSCGGAELSELVPRWDFSRRGSRDRPEGGGVSTSRDRNRGSPAAVREPLPAGDRVPTRQDGRVRGRFRGADQARSRAPDR